MENGGYLDALVWQVMVFVLVGLAGFLAFWLAKHYRRWLARRVPQTKWAAVSAWGVGLLLFVVFAVVFGYFLDQSRGV